VIEEYDGSNSVYYIREPDGELIARIGSSSVAYYHFDALGSTRLLTDAMGTVTDTYAYDAWGNVMMHTGTTTQPYQFVGELGYHTHWQDENLTLLQLGVRFYDPEIGRFGQRDALANDTNWYGYADGVPTVLTDPSGLECTPISGWEPDPTPRISAWKWEYRTAWKFWDWHPAYSPLVYTYRACYCHWIRENQRRRRWTSTICRKVSCMYHTNCGWVRRIEDQCKDIPSFGPWERDPSPTISSSDNPCDYAHTTWGLVAGDPVPWCTCELKPPQEEP